MTAQVAALPLYYCSHKHGRNILQTLTVESSWAGGQLSNLLQKEEEQSIIKDPKLSLY